MVFDQPRTFEARKLIADVLVQGLGCRLPVAIDAIDNPVEKVFAAWPERLYILEPGGRVVYKGGMGPFGFDVDEAERALKRFLAG
jgi:hypothetical protein